MYAFVIDKIAMLIFFICLHKIARLFISDVTASVRSSHFLDITVCLTLY